MKGLHKFIIVLVLSLLIASSFLITSSYASYALVDTPAVDIEEWEMMWEENSFHTAVIPDPISNKNSNEWHSFSYEDELPVKPANIQSAWLRFQLPEFDLARPSLLISELTARDVMIFIDNKLVYESSRNYPYYKNEILLSLGTNESNKMVYILMHTNSNWLGLKKQIIVGENQSLSNVFMKNDMFDVVMGASLVSVSLAMFLCFIFLNKSYLAGLSSLCVVICSIGLMILALSPYLHHVFKEYGFAIFYMFDICSNLLIPSVFSFFEKIFGKGPFRLISRFRKLQVVISIISILWLAVSFASDKIRDIYTEASIFSFGGSIIIGNSLLIIILIKYCLQKNKDAIILTVGFGVFAVIGVSEVVWYFIQNLNYELFFWKVGVLCFIVSLVIILARRILHNYEQVVKYSKQLEVFNNELQRSERMEIISQLAASVAHEVRNPLQVTRGFLQLLREKTTNEKDKGYMVLATEELDRASDIITDFLTFAKPQLDQTTLLDVAEEIKKIEGILAPLANMQGGVIEVDLASDLYVRGNSSKLKQALINIIKNSIEALDKEGNIFIRTYMDDSKNVVIRIKDNGEGMHEADLKRLGEPYYSKKTKGTGLGLMVTFRIIEVMQGKVSFISNKGVGTEAVIHIPSANK